jgi:hypothetical protein
VLKTTQDAVGSRIEIRPRGGRFICEIAEVVPNREIRIEYVEGVHRGTGCWTFEKRTEDIRACYQIELDREGKSLLRTLRWSNMGF